MLVAVLTAALIALATYRVTRFLVRDSFPPMALGRARLQEAFGDGSAFAYLITCSWCSSIYVGGAIVAGTDSVSSVPLPVLTWLAASAVTGFLATMEPEDR